MDFRLFNREFGNADLFLIDWILKGMFKEGKKILDAGCGEGRNLDFFLRNDFDVYGADNNDSALRMLSFKVKSAGKNFDTGHFACCDLVELPFESNFFDYVICFSVLHFAKSKGHFIDMFRKFTDVLKPGGFIFLSMNSVFGAEKTIFDPASGLYELPGGEIRYLMDEALLELIFSDHHLIRDEPLRTVIVHGYESRSYLKIQKKN